MLKKLRIWVANLLFKLCLWVLPADWQRKKHRDDADIVLEIPHPKQIRAAVESPLWVGAEKIGHVDFSLGNPPPVSRQMATVRGLTPVDYELVLESIASGSSKPVDQFEEDISKAIIDALKSERAEEREEEEE